MDGPIQTYDPITLSSGPLLNNLNLQLSSNPKRWRRCCTALRRGGPPSPSRWPRRRWCRPHPSPHTQSSSFSTSPARQPRPHTSVMPPRPRAGALDIDTRAAMLMLMLMRLQAAIHTDTGSLPVRLQSTRRRVRRRAALRTLRDALSLARIFVVRAVGPPISLQRRRHTELEWWLVHTHGAAIKAVAQHQEGRRGGVTKWSGWQ